MPVRVPDLLPVIAETTAATEAHAERVYYAASRAGLLARGHQGKSGGYAVLRSLDVAGWVSAILAGATTRDGAEVLGRLLQLTARVPLACPMLGGEATAITVMAPAGASFVTALAHLIEARRHGPVDAFNNVRLVRVGGELWGEILPAIAPTIGIKTFDDIKAAALQVSPDLTLVRTVIYAARGASEPAWAFPGAQQHATRARHEIHLPPGMVQALADALGPASEPAAWPQVETISFPPHRGEPP